MYMYTNLPFYSIRKDSFHIFSTSSLSISLLLAQTVWSLVSKHQTFNNSNIYKTNTTCTINMYKAYLHPKFTEGSTIFNISAKCNQQTLVFTLAWNSTIYKQMDTILWQEKVTITPSTTSFFTKCCWNYFNQVHFIKSQSEKLSTQKTSTELLQSIFLKFNKNNQKVVFIGTMHQS